EIISECIRMVRDKVGPVAAFKIAVIVKRLPKTRSGKILRKTIRKLASEFEIVVPPTIDDPLILEEIREIMKERGIGQYATS
ncbi:MAG TPA: propionyl-CoA synthetase, partial [Deltaproteobacteria bacterium]|nr:propionyl-CoA synthetase [Deltaproteobacteria bacterium]